MNIRFVLILFSFFLNACGKDEPPSYYEYDFVSSNDDKKITFRFDDLNVSKYPGWKHGRDNNARIDIWYPSLLDKSSKNVWMSSKEEFEKSHIPINPNDRKLSLSVGGKANDNILVNPDITLEERPIYRCNLRHQREDFFEDGIVGIFESYKAIETWGDKPHVKVSHLYIPTKKTRGIHCIKCNGTTCILYGVTDFGVRYTALEREEVGRMAKEAFDIHTGVSKYLKNKIVN